MKKINLKNVFEKCTSKFDYETISSVILKITESNILMLFLGISVILSL